MARTYEQHEYEDALEQVMAYMEHPPAPGSEQDRAFSELLEYIRSYEPSVSVDDSSGDPDADLRRELEIRIESLRRRTHREVPEHGIGPTLGMDVSHS